MRAVRSASLVLLAACLLLAASAMLPTAPAHAQDYDMSFSLPTYGKSGCMVCHGDRNLVRLRGNQAISYWIDEEVIGESAHADIMCTGCHVDFSYSAPHEEGLGEDWRATAKLACKNCHDERYQAYSLGVHSISSTPGENGTETAEPEREEPLCGDCHGDHGIQMLTDNPAGRAEMRAEGARVCGRCHEDRWENYDDYYHGAAYKAGAPDAPACWDCHDYHTILPADDRRSTVHESSLVETCGQCHKEVNEGYLTYTDMIHGREAAYNENPVYRFLLDIRERISDAVAGVTEPMLAWLQ